MSKFIKDFDGFVNEENSFIDSIGSVFSNLGQGFTDTIKKKITAAMLSRLGIKEDGVFTVFVQEFVDEIPIKDYPMFLTGDFDMKYWAPKIVNSFMGFISREGLDPLIEKMGFEKTGWIASTLRETLQNEMKKEKFEKGLINFLLSFSGEGMGDEINKSLSTGDREKISSSLYDVAKKQSTESDKSSGGSLDNILSVFGATKK